MLQESVQTVLITKTGSLCELAGDRSADPRASSGLIVWRSLEVFFSFLFFNAPFIYLC